MREECLTLDAFRNLEGYSMILTILAKRYGLLFTLQVQETTNHIIHIKSLSIGFQFTIKNF
jgi:hypothetical protein